MRHRGLGAFAFFLVALAAASVPARGWTEYTNGFPAEGRFFPLAVWQQSPHDAARYKSMGINTFVGLPDRPTEAGLEELAKQGIFAVSQESEAALNLSDASVIRAWLQPDEPDNAQPIAPGQYGPCVPAREVVRRTQQMNARDPTRPVMINFGRGVADEEWAGRQSCTGDVKYYDLAVEGAGIVSFDIYPVGSDVEREKDKLQYVARGVRRLVRQVKGGQQVWAIVETTALHQQRPVKPEELRAEVWMALVSGARGIVYFVHEWEGGYRADGIFRHPDIVAAATRIDRQVTALAPVLNSPTLDGKVAVSSPVPIATMAKQYEGVLYLFAVAMRNTPSMPWFAIRGLGDAEADVLGEGRKIPIRGGILYDSFAGYGVHLYRILLGEGMN